jgi:hypothetical protein
MCLALYFACEGQLPVRHDLLRSPPEFSIQEIRPTAESVRQWFSLPVIRYIGTHTGCSCGFRHVYAEVPIDYWEGMFEYDEADQDTLRTAQLLIDLIHEKLALTDEIQMYPVWDGDEGVAPKGTIQLASNTLDPRTFFFNEQFFYRVRRPRLTG